MNIGDFIEVSKDHFFAVLNKKDGPKHEWAKESPPDISWWEAHIEVVINTETRASAGYRRTSSYGTPDEYHLHHSLIPKKMDQI